MLRLSTNNIFELSYYYDNSKLYLIEVCLKDYTFRDYYKNFDKLPKSLKKFRVKTQSHTTKLINTLDGSLMTKITFK